MRQDAKATVAAAFDNMIFKPSLVSYYKSRVLSLFGHQFDCQLIQIGYVSFLIAATPGSRFILMDVELADGEPVFVRGAYRDKAKEDITRKIIDKFMYF